LDSTFFETLALTPLAGQASLRIIMAQARCIAQVEGTDETSLEAGLVLQRSLLDAAVAHDRRNRIL